MYSKLFLIRVWFGKSVIISRVMDSCLPLKMSGVGFRTASQIWFGSSWQSSIRSCGAVALDHAINSLTWSPGRTLSSRLVLFSPSTDDADGYRVSQLQRMLGRHSGFFGPCFSVYFERVSTILDGDLTPDFPLQGKGGRRA